MRSLLLASLLFAAALVACDQHSLTDNKTGTGGAGSSTGAGGAGGSVSGTGGSALQTFCDQLATEYQIAVTASQSCTPGAASQCEIAVPAVLSACGSCPTMVNDDTKPDAIKAQWQSAGCLTARPPVPCVQSLCIAPPAMCIPSPTGGLCSSTSGAGGQSGGGSGGSTGKGGSTGTDGGVSACDALAAKYQTVLGVVETCTVGATNQCKQLVPAWLSACGTCSTYVNDATELNQIETVWQQAGCGTNVDLACPIIDCIGPPSAGSCVGTDGGAGTCSIAAFAGP